MTDKEFKEKYCNNQNLTRKEIKIKKRLSKSLFLTDEGNLVNQDGFLINANWKNQKSA